MNQIVDIGDFVLVGEVDAGKTSLLMNLLEVDGTAVKTQAVEHYRNNIIDTPGEYISRRSYYGPLLTALIGIDTILYLHPSNSRSLCMPIDLLHVYANKRIVGVITKTDLEDADIEFSKRLLVDHGIKEPIFEISQKDQETIVALKNFLMR
ncbi:hypothetical protein SIN8267_00537 [Sinobacterium norvegicum]|uniref:Ethanolamine utilization protein EutP n=1 Tax=Sinobacterium norvegicum TaxID=1641715 RepID=A0ABM9ABV4_9GAMM|nr:EutP/PduV family microcompartment system protein [Sinobacterium norvegicum]CAH0990445.1 hypothetical protein SIN8267_00537 [Sinobacterium norvegicum]